MKREPFLNASEIGVAVKNGVVTLSGHVDSYLNKSAAENAAKKIAGIKAVAENIRIGISPSYKQTDTDIAETVVIALKSHSAVQEEKIKIKVENGIVRLEGEVEFEYQRSAVKTTIENLAGVTGVINLITLKQKIAAADISRRINKTFSRQHN